jgi:hypothetical protein
MSNLEEKINLFIKLASLRRLKKKAILNNDASLTMHCYRQIKAIKRINVSV